MNDFTKLFGVVFGFTRFLVIIACVICHNGHCNTRFDTFTALAVMAGTWLQEEATPSIAVPVRARTVSRKVRQESLRVETCDA